MTIVDYTDRPADVRTPRAGRPAADTNSPGRTRRLLHPRRLAWLALPLLGVAVVAGLWETAARNAWLPASQVPALTDTLARLGELLGDSAFLSALGLTLRAWAIGLVIAVTIAVPLGILLGLSDRAYRFVRVPLEAIRPVPPIVILPLALLALGGSVAFQSTLIVQGALWPLLVTVTYGIREVDPTTLDTARSFRFSRTRTLIFVRLPAALPMMASGIRLAAATAFAVTIVTELVGGARGIGTVLMIGQSGGDVVTVYAVTILAGLVGLVIAFVFGLVERRVLRWKADSR